MSKKKKYEDLLKDKSLFKKNTASGLLSKDANYRITFEDKKYFQDDIPIAKINIKPQVRQKIDTDSESYRELVESIRRRGVLQPIIVVKSVENGEYELVSGERRVTAAKECRYEFIPAVIFEDLTESDILEIQLIENLQREDLTTFEKALGLKTLAEKMFKVDTIDELIKLLSNKLFSKNNNSTSTVEVDTNYSINLRQIYRYVLLFAFPEDCIELVKNSSKFPVRVFDILYKYKNHPEITNIFKLIAEGKLNSTNLNTFLNKLDSNINKEEPAKKKRIRIYNKLKKIDTNFDELLKDDLIVKDKNKAEEIIKQIEYKLNRLKEKLFSK
ncbi:conserved hypothetical protein (plasmid) [Deferribacter desulfuricans SSM1]|uniref:ParB-like N-terminal domain-containing protein n=1 Tax=Deferribacter desulfuricans (strain DSM 14783 / JCM 11476 / NBRC 101012 / SSM1) TaxID=639282 RepID=D3PF41_DEFDS|nr:ParB/RepB/Spo0J family partition protein [Deferribacter desulfuricans]BAI81833.1 conserved hypothetical protein [Deferribacter desulfuricans SSM1]